MHQLIKYLINILETTSSPAWANFRLILGYSSKYGTSWFIFALGCWHRAMKGEFRGKGGGKCGN